MESMPAAWPVLLLFLFAAGVALVAAWRRERRRALLAGRQLRDAQSSLALSDRRLQLAADAAGFGLWEWDVGSDSIWATPTTRALFGCGPGEPLDVERLRATVDIPAPEAMIGGTLEQQPETAQAGFECERLIVLPGGESRWIHTSGRVEAGAAGAAAVMRGVSFDATERRQREALLEREHAFLRQVIDINPNLIFVKDDAGRFTLVNQATADLFQTTPEALVGARDAEINPNAAQVEHFERVDRKLLQSPHEQFVAEEELTDAAGQKHWLQTVKRSIRSVDGTALHVLGTSTDITYRKQMELALKESEQRFLEVCQISGEFIWETDANGLYTYASPSVEKILGYTPQELVGRKHLHDMLPGAPPHDPHAHPLPTPTGAATVRGVLSRSGRIVQLETRAAAVLGSDGQVVGLRGADMDVTERVRAEQEIVQQRNELTHLARVSVISELSGSIAHELNQPLAAILSNAQAALRFLTRDPPDLAEIAEILRDIVDADRRAGEIMAGLRLLLKKGQVNHGLVDLNDVAHDVLRLMRSELLSGGIVPGVALAANLPKVKADRVQLQQVAMNIVVNGCDAMARNALHDRALTFRTDVTEDGFVRFSVADEGTGIVPEHLDRMFEPFFTTKPNGLGMGLAVCRKIILAHGGRIGAANRGRGADVYFALPAETGKPPA